MPSTAPTGSSPRMRGAVLDGRVLVCHARIISAHAGSSSVGGSGLCLCRDHPRACGEQEISRRLGRSRAGSSPRMRGADDSAVRERELTGIIPAHAGSRLRSQLAGRGGRDHPRACGEQGGALQGLPYIPGSSPRMRGAGLGPCVTLCDFGIIPAHAGSRRSSASRARRSGDHPRACGEQAGIITFLRLPQGSSPRMRGAAVPPGTDGAFGRIIPAHAGSR